MQEQTGAERSQAKPQIEVYTAITGQKDSPRNDITCFTDYNQFTRPVMNAKIYKVLSHKYIDSEISIWLDGNIKLLISPEQLVEEWLKDADWAMFRHPFRKCIYQEGKAAKTRFNDPEDQANSDIDRQIAHYRSIGIPANGGLAETGVLVRRHTDKVTRFNEAWWAEICRWSQRDQLSFPVISKDFKINYIKGNVREHSYFHYETH